MGRRANTQRWMLLTRNTWRHHKEQCSAKKLNIPPAEIVNSSVITEQTQAAEFDLETGRARLEDVRQGKRYVVVSRQIEELPVWSSRVCSV